MRFCGVLSSEKIPPVKIKIICNITTNKFHKFHIGYSARSSIKNAVFGVHRAELKNLSGNFCWVHLVNMLEHTIHGSNHTIMYT